MFDTLGMDSILNNQGVAQALADGLMELFKEGSVSVLSVGERNLGGKLSTNKSLVYILLTSYQFITLGHSPSEKLHQFTKAATERFWLRMY